MPHSRVRAVAANSRLGRRFQSLHANHRRIASGALTIAALTLLAKAFVAGREVAIAYRYGVSATVDAYQLSLTIVTWVPMLLSSVLTVVLVPRLISLDGRKDKRAAFISEFNGSVFLLGGGVALITFLAAPIAARLMAARLGPATLQMTTSLVERMAPVALFMIVAGYLTTRLQAKERFGYTVTEAVPALIIALLVAGPFGLPGVLPLILGTVFGYFAQVLILSRLVVRGDPPLGELLIRHRSDEWHTFYGSILLMFAGQLVIMATIPIDQWFAARIGEGAVATLGYANRIVTLFTGLAGVVVGRALLPVLSRTVAEGDVNVGRRQSLQWAGLMFCAAVAGSLVLWVAAPELVKLLFERGAFQADATAAVSNVLQYGLIQMPFFFGGIALVQWMAATGRFKDIVWITAVALATKVLLNVILVPNFGLRGIMISSAVMYLVTSMLMAAKISRGAKS
jgi:murein biosynthesis integral membrane protein MurJ